MNQGTQEWFEARLGKLTASNMDAAMGVKKDGSDMAERWNLKMKILAERLTGQAASNYVNDAMRHGIENEPVAKDILKQIGYEIQEVGFIEHHAIKDFGASPDGFIEDGLIEIKCPTTQTHIKWLISGVIPEEHKPQMLAQIACTRRKWCDFISFDPRIKDTKMGIFKRRYIPSVDEIKKVEEAALKLLSEVEEMESLIRDAYL